MKLLRPKDCAAALGISQVSLWRWTKVGDFPEPFQLGKQCIAWDADEIREWLETRRRAKTAAATSKPGAQK